LVSLHGKCNGSGEKTDGRDAKHADGGLESSGVIFLGRRAHGGDVKDGERCVIFSAEKIMASLLCGGGGDAY
jgi:hypothetical protein